SADPTAAIEQALGNPSVYHITVVVDERGDVIGSCHTSMMGDEHPRPAPLHDLIVGEPYRGQGLGPAPPGDAVPSGADRAVHEVCLGVAPLSTRSRWFYERHGFEETNILLVRTVSGDA